jgi:hypothetical protein
MRGSANSASDAAQEKANKKSADVSRWLGMDQLQLDLGVRLGARSRRILTNLQFVY